MHNPNLDNVFHWQEILNNAYHDIRSFLWALKWTKCNQVVFKLIELAHPFILYIYTKRLVFN